MSKKYSIEVWDIQFYKVDEDGDELLNEDGSVKLFRDKGHISWQERIVMDDDDLVERES